MRNLRRISLALLAALACASPTMAQGDRFSFNAAVGPSFANLGTTFSSTAGLDVRLNNRASIVGEFGTLPHAPFRDAAMIAPAGEGALRVNAYHWNGNLRVEPLQKGRVETYVTTGLGSFIADTIIGERMVGATRIDERRRANDFATNLGGGIFYRFNDWVGAGADYRTFFVHRGDDTPMVNRLTAGLRFSIK
jgi:hypothetical protein